MKFWRRVRFCIVLLVVLSCVPTLATGQETVFVSILPQKYFVQRISGGEVKVEVMVRPGASPATYEPKASQMRKLAECPMFFAVGVPFEQAWLERIRGVNPEMRIIHTEAGIKKMAMEDHHHEEHGADALISDKHHDGHHDAHDDARHDAHDDVHDDTDKVEGLDPHIWLSPALVKKQVAVIYAALAELVPAKKELFTRNYEKFLQDIEKVDMRVRKTLEGKQGARFMVFHPSWGYFAREYGLEQIAVEIEGKNPKPAQLKELIEHAREEGIRVVFAQPQFSQKSVEIIARSIGGQVILIDPLGENWLDNMQEVAEQFRKGL